MAEPTTKAGLQEQVRAQFAALDAAIAPILPAQMVVPGVNGAWSVKDALAHLTFWDRHLLARLQSAATRQPPSDTAIDDDTWNRRCFDVNRARALNDVLADLWRAQQHILNALETVPEANLF